MVLFSQIHTLGNKLNNRKVYRVRKMLIVKYFLFAHREGCCTRSGLIIDPRVSVMCYGLFVSKSVASIFCTVCK